MSELTEQIKTRLGITGTYHDAMLEAYAEDVKAFMMSGGVSQKMIDDIKSIGCIARGVADLWNYGGGDGEFSQIFIQRVTQLAFLSHIAEETEPTVEPMTKEDIDNCTGSLYE